MSGYHHRETIQLSLGPIANSISAHLLNLQGLAVTASPNESGDVPICNPYITHQRDSTRSENWVPRVILVDESHRLQQQQQQQQWRPQRQISNQDISPFAMGTADSFMKPSTWNGSFQQVNLETFSFYDQFSSGMEGSDKNNIVTHFDLQHHHHHYHHHIAPKPKSAWLQSWQETSSRLAYAPYSQYRISSSSQEEQSSHPLPPASPPSTTTLSRHYNWDDLGDEEPEQDDEEELLQHRKRQRREQEKQWEGERLHYEEKLLQLWGLQQQQQQPANKMVMSAAVADQNSDNTNNNNNNKEEEQPSMPTEDDLSNLSWMDYWMPPIPSPLTQCAFGLPSSRAASSVDALPLHAFNVATTSSNGGSSKILLEDYWEMIRLQLESMDACQGFTILTEGSGIYAGMSDWILQEIQQECRAAGRWVFHVDAGEDDDNNSNNNEIDLSSPYRDSIHQKDNVTELSLRQTRLRNNVQNGLVLAGLSDHAQLMVPLILPPSRRMSLFRATAELAMALETATLPYRCQTSGRNTLVGWNSISGYEQGTSPSTMSMHDYQTTLQPSSRYSLLELDTVITSASRKCLGQTLVAGTSVERDPRMRRQPNAHSGSTTEYPGSWLADENYKPLPGILTSLSPDHVANQDRALHYHYGMSTCLRRNRNSGSPLLNDDNQEHLTCIMEGMGIRYRPETAFGLVTNQNLSQLTNTGRLQGAGSYWKYVVGAGMMEVPVLSVLGNTTRMYPHLCNVARNMKEALKSSKTRGYYQREVAFGTLPESDDCNEALERCFDLRDTYEPPNGSGLLDDREHDNYYLDE